MFYGFLLVVVILAVFLLNYQIQQNKHRTEAKSGANLVSHVGDDFRDVDSHAVKQNIINVAPREMDFVVADGEAPTTVLTLSYLEIYQQLQTAKACHPFYDFWRRNGLAADSRKIVRPPVKLYGTAVYPPGEQVPLSAGQTAALTDWVKRCYGLWLDYGVFNQSDNQSIPINDISETLTKKLLATVPQSKKGRAIKQTRQLAAQWQRSFAQLETTLEGEDSINQAEIDAVHDEVEKLKQLREDLRLQWMDVRYSDESLAKSLLQQRNDLRQQIHQYEVELESQKVLNQDALNQVLAGYQIQDQKLNQALYSDVAEVFYEALTTLENQQVYWLSLIGFANHSITTQALNQYRITPDQLVYEASGWQNRWLHSSDLRYAAQWYLCDLGMDCGPQSPIVMHYCLLGFSSSPRACGQNLQSFFYNDLISPNRLQDVLQFKNHYQELFGE